MTDRGLRNYLIGWVIVIVVTVFAVSLYQGLTR